MDRVYRIFQKGEDPRTGEVVTGLRLKSIITQPLADETLPRGPVTILGTAYAGEDRVERVDVSVDGGQSWLPATFIGPDEPYAWRQWQFVWNADKEGDYTLMARAAQVDGRMQPATAEWNVQGYYNTGVHEHSIRVSIR